jgi:phytanoyl-CoA hydroxylase
MIEGSFDGFEEALIIGWAWDRSDQACRLTLQVCIDNEPFTDAIADLERPDLQTAGVGDGKYGFCTELPRQLMDGELHRISLREKSSGAELMFSPRSVCSRLFVHQHDLGSGSPWVDRPDAPERIREKFDNGEIGFEDMRRLTFWHDNGFVILRSAIDLDLIRWCNRHIDEMVEQRLPVLFGQQDGSLVPFDQANFLGSFVGSRFLEFHSVSQAALQLSMDPKVLSFLRLVFEDTPVCMQSLLFLQGSTQNAHTDYPYVHTKCPAFLAASWIALEDVDMAAGPLFYYPGSHRVVPPYDFGFGNVMAFGDGPHIRGFEVYLENQCRVRGLSRLELDITAGDLLIWHSALVHGGSPVLDASKTRRSFVTHFSSSFIYTEDRKYPGQPPLLKHVNGGIFYDYRPGDYPIGHFRILQ